MNLDALRQYCGSLLDYDPVNPTYTSELTSFLNDAQGRLLGDRPWSFLVREEQLEVKTDITLTLTFTAGSAQVTGTGFPVGTVALPGSPYELGTMTFEETGGTTATYQIRYVQNSTTLYIDRPFVGNSGAYTVTMKRRNVHLQSDTAQVMSVLQDITSYPQQIAFMSKLDRDSYLIDPDILGTPESYLEGEAEYVPAPRNLSGVSVITPGAGRGVRTVKIYMVNVRAPDYYGFDSYPGYSGGLESGLSPAVEYDLADNEELQFNPAAIDEESGLYRRFYFTCTAEGIDAPRRVRSSTGTSTVPPPGIAVPFTGDTSLTALQAQSLDTNTPRYQRTQSGAHQALELYPHPSADTRINVRRLLVPQDMEEAQDTPAVPSAYARVLAYEALSQLAIKADQAPLAAAFERKMQMVYKGMEQRYLGKPSRRIVKNSSGGIYPTIFGPLTFT